MSYHLRVTDGPDAGKHVTLGPGRALVGRSDSAAMKLSDPDVSWEHAVITVGGERVKIANLSARGTQVSGKPLSAPAALHAGDQIRLTEQTRLVIEPSQQTAGSAGGLILLLGAAIVAVALVGALVMFAEDEPVGPPSDWPTAYLHLDGWVQRQVQAQQLPELVLIQLRNGWRLDRNHNYQEAANAWLELSLLLQGLENAPGGAKPNAAGSAQAGGRSAEHDGALDELLQHGPSARDDDATNAAALIQFARRSYQWNRKQAAEAEEAW